MTIMKNKTIAKINKRVHVHVHDGVMMNVGLMRMVVAMVNDDAIGHHHYVNHDDDRVHDRVLLNADVVVDIV